MLGGYIQGYLRNRGDFDVGKSQGKRKLKNYQSTDQVSLVSTSMDTYKARDRLMSRFTKGSMGRELFSEATVRAKVPKRKGPLS